MRRIVKKVSNIVHGLYRKQKIGTRAFTLSRLPSRGLSQGETICGYRHRQGVRETSDTEESINAGTTSIALRSLRAEKSGSRRLLPLGAINVYGELQGAKGTSDARGLEPRGLRGSDRTKETSHTRSYQIPSVPGDALLRYDVSSRD